MATVAQLQAQLADLTERIKVLERQAFTVRTLDELRLEQIWNHECDRRGLARARHLHLVGDDTA
jgi:hypothetical protein